MKRLELSFDRRRQVTVVVGRGALRELAGLWPKRSRRAALVADETVMALWGDAVAHALPPAVAVTRATFAPGEAHKTRATKAAIEDALIGAGFDRDDCILALGGGISLDVAGFIAATMLRGIDYVSVPTSLLAQVDACIGGKTGINAAAGKNLVGAMHQPSAVIVDPALLSTLPRAEWANGVAEMIKIAAMFDAALFADLERVPQAFERPDDPPTDLIARSIACKAQVVEADEQERSGRAGLNFGHTIGHAIEQATRHAIAHGRAVAAGMVVEMRAAVAMGVLARADAERVTAAIAAAGLDTAGPALPFSALEPALAVDKKVRGGVVHVAVPSAVGEMAGGGAIPIDREALAEAWGTPP